MRFVCPEASGAIDSKDAVEMVYRYVFRSTDNPNTERIQTESSTFLPIMGEIDTKTKSNLRLFAPSAVYPFSGRIPLSGTPRAISALATALGISITLTDTDTAAYYWYAENVFDLYSIPYYLTIYNDGGLILAKPKRISTSQNRGKLVDKDCVKRQFNQLNPGYDGETGFDYTIAADTAVMSPALITNTYKDLCLNKHLAIRNYIYFSIPKKGINDQGYDPLDFVVGPGGYNYIIVSKQDDPDGLYYLYTAVREFDETRSYSGGDVTPVILNLSDKKRWTLLGTKTLLNVTSQTSDQNLKFLCGCIDADSVTSADSDTSAKTRLWIVTISITINYAGGSGRVVARLAAGNTAANTADAKIFDFQLPTSVNRTQKKSFKLSHGSWNIHIDETHTSGTNYSVNVVGKEIQDDFMIYDDIT